MFDKMNTNSIILILYKHKLINRSLSLPFNFLLQGQVVVLVQSVEGQSSYDVLAVGKVSGVATSDLVPVLVAFVQPKAAHLLSVGQVVLWPKTLVAVYGEPVSYTHLTLPTKRIV